MMYKQVFIFKKRTHEDIKKFINIIHRLMKNRSSMRLSNAVDFCLGKFSELLLILPHFSLLAEVKFKIMIYLSQKDHYLKFPNFYIIYLNDIISK